MNKEWGINALHALYRESGTWYHHLKKFPGALLDKDGFLLFKTKEEYLNCRYLQLGKQLSVPKGIASLPGYVRVKYTYNEQASDIEEPQETYRVISTINRIVRDTPLARKIKILHNYTCQLCNEIVLLFNNQPYAEAHHVKPLGSKHNGPDIKSNILCVCPKCHVQLDYGAIILKMSDITVVATHKIDKRYIIYHNTIIYKSAEAQKQQEVSANNDPEEVAPLIVMAD